ncbi:MAG: TerB family tellurite resistance protein [Candidatus Obscuribacterales bacterium]|nr:TerB family tellurite resistance protein [Candidatus Obscuribacterales bacterium]
MSNFWDTIRQNAEAAHAELAKKASRFNNRAFLESVIAAAALITAADGKVDSAETDKVLGFLNKNAALAGWSSDEKAKLFRDSLKQAGDEFDAILLWGKVAKQKGNDEAATTMVGLAALIANADGDFADAEKAILKRICSSVGVDPAPYL